MSALDLDDLAWLDNLHLAHGSHDDPSQGACVMEAVAFLAKESFTDHPECASPVIGAFLRALNDQWDDERRQTLKRHIPTLIGTRTTPEDEETRAWMATDWLVRVHTPAFLRLAGLNDHADTLETMAPLDGVTTPELLPVIRAAAGDAAWAAAGDAARAAAWAALRPTVEGLQPSIHDLIERMCAVGRSV